MTDPVKPISGKKQHLLPNQLNRRLLKSVMLSLEETRLRRTKQKLIRKTAKK